MVYKRLEGLLFLLKIAPVSVQQNSGKSVYIYESCCIFVATWVSLRWQHFKVATFGR